MMISSEKAVSHVSAAEITERAGERMAIISPMLVQFDGDVGDKVIGNLLQIAKERGTLLPPPQSMRGAQIKPFYTSILAQASRASMVSSLERATSYLGALANTTQDPAVLKLINAEKVGREYMDYVGVDPELVLNEREYGEVKEAMANQQAQAQAQANAAVDASIAKDLAAAESPQGSQLNNLNQMSQF